MQGKEIAGVVFNENKPMFESKLEEGTPYDLHNAQVTLLLCNIGLTDNEYQLTINKKNVDSRNASLEL